MATLARYERQINKFGDTQRWYEVPGGREYPSVTTAMGVMAKHFLIKWSATVERQMVLAAVESTYKNAVEPCHLTLGVPAPRADDFMERVKEKLGKERAHSKALQKAANIGSEAHHWIEWSLRQQLGQEVGPTPVLSPPAQKAINGWKLWREQVELKPLMVERMVYSDQFRYAGTMDFLAEMTHEGQRIKVLADIKTGSAIYDEAKRQVTAYVVAAKEMGLIEDHVPGLIVRLPKKGPEEGFEAQLVPVADMPKHFKVFQCALKLFNALEACKPSVEEL